MLSTEPICILYSKIEKEAGYSLSVSGFGEGARGGDGESWGMGMVREQERLFNFRLYTGCSKLCSIISGFTSSCKLGTSFEEGALFICVFMNT